jgi:cytoskeletal protein CcmA (bactofilin family)
MFRSRSTKRTTVVAREAHFEGSLELAGSAHIEGSFKGILRAEGDLSIGPDGCVEGTLEASAIVIAGRVLGTVVSKTLHVLKDGSVQGQVFYEAMQVDHGGAISGEVRRGAPEQRPAHATEQAAEADSSGIAPAAPRAVQAGPAPITLDTAVGQ